MIFQQFIEKDLGHVSYVFGDEDTKEVAIVDPKRDINEYVKYIKKGNLTLKYILNTHTHADYIGGHLELVEVYPKAKNIFQADVPAKFDFIKAKNKDTFKLGNLKLKILQTPGHTPYCISCIINENNIDKYIFTGDILFVGDIARPDLLGKMLLDKLLYSSYKTAKKLWKLPDDMILFTSHIKGSLCGKNLKSQFFSTIGIEKRTNYSFSLIKKSKKKYINNLKTQSLETPSFFKKMATINIQGATLLKNIKQPKLLKPSKFFKQVKKTDYIIDFRDPDSFKQGYIQNSINIYEHSNIALILGSLIDIESRLFLVGDKNTNFKQIIKKLRRIGFDHIKAILKEDVSNLKHLVQFEDKNYTKLLSLDGSKADVSCQISDINTLNIDKSYDIICQNGYKSMAVKSFLRRKHRG